MVNQYQPVDTSTCQLQYSNFVTRYFDRLPDGKSVSARGYFYTES
jgi:hypothetical protein